MIAFLLRGASIQEDLALWHQVFLLLPKDQARMVGYCDGDECVAAARRMQSPSGFSILAYGEMISAQSVVNADAKGFSIFSDNRHSGPKLVAWRNAEDTPQSFVQKVLR
jgi:hypothetical protein